MGFIVLVTLSTPFIGGVRGKWGRPTLRYRMGSGSENVWELSKNEVTKVTGRRGRWTVVELSLTWFQRLEKHVGPTTRDELL